MQTVAWRMTEFWGGDGVCRGGAVVNHFSVPDLCTCDHSTLVSYECLPARGQEAGSWTQSRSVLPFHLVCINTSSFPLRPFRANYFVALRQLLRILCSLSVRSLGLWWGLTYPVHYAVLLSRHVFWGSADKILSPARKVSLQSSSLIWEGSDQNEDRSRVLVAKPSNIWSPDTFFSGEEHSSSHPWDAGWKVSVL